MIPAVAEFRAWYAQQGGSPQAANSYITYLRRVDALCGGIDHWLKKKSIGQLAEWAEGMPPAAFGSDKNRRDSLSAVRKYVRFHEGGVLKRFSLPTQIVEQPQLLDEEIKELLRSAKVLGARYYQLTGKPLGVTGEVAELAAAEKLGLRLCSAREPGFDAWDFRQGLRHRIQIKGRSVDPQNRYRGRCPSIKVGDLFDTVLLVLLDKTTLEPIEIWEATEDDVARRLGVPGSKARNERNSMSISQFKSIAARVWQA